MVPEAVEVTTITSTSSNKGKRKLVPKLEYSLSHCQSTVQVSPQTLWLPLLSTQQSGPSES